MPSKNMLPKGKRRQSVKQEYRTQRTLTQEREAALRAAGVVEEQPEDEVAEQPVSPFAHVPGLVTSGPSGGKHPQEQKDQTQRRYPAPKVPVEAPPEIQVLDDLEAEDGVRSFAAEPAAAGMRLDAYLAKALPEISRARVVLLIEGGQVTVDGDAAKGKQKLKGGEWIEIEGEPRPAPLNAEPEDIPLTIVYEDDDLAVVNKAAGMMVHAGAGEAGVANKGTLVNALLHHFGNSLSGVGGELRPGIVHRLDKQTSGLIVVAKNDGTHRKLAEMFADRRLRKIYLALVHGWVGAGSGDQNEGTVTLPISRDVVRRTRMTTRRAGGRSAVSHWKVLERIGGVYGRFTLLEIHIETGRTHQIRVHMQALGHPVVGDFLYGAPHHIAQSGTERNGAGRSGTGRNGAPNVEGEGISLGRNFLHAAELELEHPRTGKQLKLRAELPAELEQVLNRMRQPVATQEGPRRSSQELSERSPQEVSKHSPQEGRQRGPGR